MADPAEPLLYVAGSPAPNRVGIMLEELGLTYRLRFVRMLAGEQFSAEFLALNPFGKVPVLVDPEVGRPLFESGAILLYLAERHARFLPEDGPDRYEVLEWLMAQLTLVGPLFGQLAHFRGVLGPGTHPYAEARYAEQVRRLFTAIDERLDSTPWLVGEAYSIADIAAYPWAVMLKRFGFAPSDFPSVDRWRRTIAARPAVQRFAERLEQASREARDAPQNITDEDLDRFYGRPADAPKADFSRVRTL